MKARTADERTVLRIAGEGAVEFLQDLVTNDVAAATEGRAVWAALLTPQGRYLSDFLVFLRDGALMLDVDAGQAPALAQRLSMYRLRRKLEIGDAGLAVVQLWGEGAAEVPGAIADPRDPALGARLYGAAPPEGAEPATRADWDALRVGLGVPEAGAELDGDAFVLEHGFERLHGVDFRKGCYVGQEIVARMKHKTELRRGLRRVAVEGAAAPGTEVTTAEEKPAGRLGTVAGGEGLALLRLDRAEGELRAGEARLRVIG